jgi:hypothetical protein
MNLKGRYQDDYVLLARLRFYIEKEMTLASVNFWRDSLQFYREFEIVEKRIKLLTPEYRANEFVSTFCAEEFPDKEENIHGENIRTALKCIESREGPETLRLLKHFLIDYAMAIAHSCREDWLSFVGLKDSVSDEEELFLDKIRTLFQLT